MADVSIPGPPGKAAFLRDHDAAEWLGVSEDALERVAEHLPWLVRHKRVGKVFYAREDLALLATLMKKNAVPPEFFSRAGEGPQRPAKARKGADDEAQDSAS